MRYVYICGSLLPETSPNRLDCIAASAVNADCETSAWKYLCVCICAWVCTVCQWGWLSLSSHQSQYQAGRSHWCSCRWKGVCGSCCPRRTPWLWTGPGARRPRSSSPTSWPLAGRSAQSQPPWSGAYVREGRGIQGDIRDSFYHLSIGWLLQYVLFFDFCLNFFINWPTNNNYSH